MMRIWYKKMVLVIMLAPSVRVYNNYFDEMDFLHKIGGILVNHLFLNRCLKVNLLKRRFYTVHTFNGYFYIYLLTYPIHPS